MSLYSTAVAAINTVRESTQAQLDAAAAAARAEHIRALRADLRDTSDTPLAAIKNLLAETISVGREDGYPAVEIPQETKLVICAAIQAGIVEAGDRIDFGIFKLHKDASGMAVNHPAFEADYKAWSEAEGYRRKQLTTLR